MLEEIARSIAHEFVACRVVPEMHMRLPEHRADCEKLTAKILEALKAVEERKQQ